MRAGNVIAFGVEGYKGKESVVVVAEVEGDRPSTRSRAAIHQRVLEVGRPPAARRDARAAGHAAEDVVAASCSGRKCREQYLNEELALV